MRDSVIAQCKHVAWRLLKRWRELNEHCTRAEYAAACLELLRQVEVEHAAAREAIDDHHQEIQSSHE